MAGAAQHASPTLSTLSERSAQSDTLKNARPSPQATRRCGVIAHRSIRRSRIHKSCVRLLTCVAAGAACRSGCRTCALTLHGAGAPAAARAWPPHPIRVVDMGETARTSCDRRSCLWQPLTRSCLRQPCVRVGGAMRVRRTAGAAGHASQTLSTLSERTARSHVQRIECVPHVQHHHPCPPSAARRSLWMVRGEGWWGSVGGECGRAWASLQAAAYGWCRSARISAALHAERALGSIGVARKSRPSLRPTHRCGVCRSQLDREFGAPCVRVETLRVIGCAASGTGVTPAPGGARWAGCSRRCGLWGRVGQVDAPSSRVRISTVRVARWTGGRPAPSALRQRIVAVLRQRIDGACPHARDSCTPP